MAANMSQEQVSAYQRRGRQILFDQVDALNAVIHELHLRDVDHETPSIWMPALMLQAVGVSFHSILALTRVRDMAIRDGFGIARSAVETALNAAWIVVEGNVLAERAIRHMRQKRWRDLDRRATFGDIEIAASRDIGMKVTDFPELQEALDEFTGKGGREITSWTQASVPERVAQIMTKDRGAGLALGSAVFGIYRPASELLHGSYYGVNFFWQGSRDTPAKDAQAFDQLWLLEHFVTLMSCMFFCASGAIAAVAAVHQLPAHSSRQNVLSAQLGLLIAALSGEDPDDEHTFRATPTS